MLLFISIFVVFHKMSFRTDSRYIECVWELKFYPKYITFLPYIMQVCFIYYVNFSVSKWQNMRNALPLHHHHTHFSIYFVATIIYTHLYFCYKIIKHTARESTFLFSSMRFRLLFKPLMYTLWRWFGWMKNLLEIEHQHPIIYTLYTHN